MNKNSKILVLILSLVIIVSAAFVMSASAAETDPKVEIVSKNLSYEDNIRILFAVKAENIGDADIALKVYEEDPLDNPEAEVKETVYAAYTESINSYGECEVFFTKGIAAKFLGKQIYAQAEVTVDGVTYKSQVERYSIVEYCHEMIAKESTDAAKDAKYMDVIEYGAAIQSFLTDDGKYNGALATEYKYVTIEGGTLDGKYDSGIYLAGAKVYPNISGATKLVTDAGEVVNNDAEYTVAGNVSFGKADEKALATETFDKSNTLPSCVTSSATHPDLSSNVLNSYSVVTPSVTTVDGHSSNALKVSAAYGASKAILKFAETAEAEENATAVEFEADMMIDWGSNSTSAEFFNFVLVDSNNTVAYNLVFRCTSTAGSLGLAYRTNAGGLYGNTRTFLSGQDKSQVNNANADWFKFRVVYTCSDAGLSAQLYKDGVLMDTVTVPATANTYVDDANITNAYIIVNGRNSAAHTVSCDVAVDNVVFRKIAD